MAAGVTIDELIGFNDELLALSRSGLPLEAPLLAGEAADRAFWRRLARDVGQVMERGVPLADALDALGPRVPGPYRAVVKAGIRSGRLADALEGVGRYARTYSDLRRKVGMAAAYPLLVLLLGYTLFVLFLLAVAPRLREAFESLRLAEPGLLPLLERLGNRLGVWGFTVPAVAAVVVLALAWAGSARQFGRMRGLARVPWLGRIVKSWHMASFTGWLSLLVEQGIPLDEALPLAAETTGDPALARSLGAVAAQVRAGVELRQALESAGKSLHPWVRWQLAAVPDGTRLAASLARTSTSFTHKAERQAEAVATVLPTLLMVLVAGFTSLVFLMSLYRPWSVLMERLGSAAA